MRRSAIVTVVGLVLAVSGGIGVATTTDESVERPTAAVDRVVPDSGQDLEATIITLQDTLRRVPKDHVSWANLAVAYVEQARVTGLASYYEKADEAAARSFQALSGRDVLKVSARGGASPRVAYRIIRVTDGGSEHITQQQVLGRPIRPETAATLTQMLASSLEGGEGSQALVPGYRIRAATGFSQGTATVDFVDFGLPGHSVLGVQARRSLVTMEGTADAVMVPAPLPHVSGARRTPVAAPALDADRESVLADWLDAS